MQSVACPKCRAITPAVRVFPLRCGCGEIIGAASALVPAVAPEPTPAQKARAIRRPICDECPHRNEDDRCGKLPAGKNRIEGPKGIRLPSACCPIKRWLPIED